MDMAFGEGTSSGSDSPRVARQLAELSLIYNIGRSLSATLDLDALLGRVVEAAVSITQADEGLLLLPDHETGELTIRAAKNLDDKLVRSLRLPAQDSLAGQVMQNGKAILVNNDRGWEKIKTEYLVRSLVYVPLIAKGDAVGVLGVDNKTKPDIFTQHDQEMLTALASYAAIAIENAQLYEDAITRARELALLAETASAVSSTLDLKHVLTTITRQIAHGLVVDWCGITLWDATRKKARPLAEYRATVWERPEGPSYRLSDYPRLARLLHGGKPFAVSVGEDDQPSLMKPGAQYLLALPLKIGGNVIGVAATYRNAPSVRTFEAKDIAGTEVALQKIAPLVLRRAMMPTWRDEALDAADGILQASNSDWCTVLLWDKENNAIREVVAYGNNESALQHQEQGADETYRMAEYAILRQVIEEQHPLIIRRDDPGLASTRRAMLDASGAQGLLLIPLIFKGKSTGVLQLGHMSRDRDFSNRELKLASALANQAAIAIENARLFGDLEQSLLDLHDAQSQLVQAARLSALGELAAAVAHQIKNPLTTIMGDAEMLMEDLSPDQSAHESAKAILRAGKRAKTVVDRLLNMARHDGDLVHLDVNETIGATLALISSQLQANGNLLEVQLTRNLPLIDGWPGQLEDVWLNLLLNSRDALMESGPGTISITSGLTPAGDTIEVNVRDSGSGIPQEHIPRVFDPFYTTKPPGKGTGLGMYICRQIVEQHKGDIRVSSEAGRGTHITVTLPVSVDEISKE